MPNWGYWAAPKSSRGRPSGRLGAWEEGAEEGTPTLCRAGESPPHPRHSHWMTGGGRGPVGGGQGRPSSPWAPRRGLGRVEGGRERSRGLPGGRWGGGRGGRGHRPSSWVPGGGQGWAAGRPPQYSLVVFARRLGL